MDNYERRESNWQDYSWVYGFCPMFLVSRVEMHKSLLSSIIFKLSTHWFWSACVSVLTFWLWMFYIIRFFGLRVNYHGSVFPPYFQQVFIRICHSFIKYSVENSLLLCKWVFKYCPSRGKVFWILLKCWTLKSGPTVSTEWNLIFYMLHVYSLLNIINN